MAIDRTGISSLQTGAPDIKYTGDQGPRSPDQQLMASADPMLVEMYQQYVFEMEEQGMQPMSFRQFMQQAMSGMAYGGTAKPTYTQSRKQNLAYGGIAGLDGRRQYGLGSWIQKAKDKVVGTVKKVAKSDLGKAALMYAGTGALGSLGAGQGLGSLTQLGTYAPSTIMKNIGTGVGRGTDWIQGLLGGSGGGGGPGYTAPTGAMGDVWDMPGAENLTYGMPQGTISNNPAWGGIESLAKNVGLGGASGRSSALQKIAGVIPDTSYTDRIMDIAKNRNPLTNPTYGTFQDDRPLWKKATDTVLDFGKGQLQEAFPGSGETKPDAQGRYPINWKGPFAIGSTMGAIAGAMPKSKLPQDTSGIKFQTAKQVMADPTQRFKPQEEYVLPSALAAEGGRIGYQDAGSVLSEEQITQIKQMNGMGSDTSTISSITGASEEQINAVLNPPVESQAQGGRIGYQGGSVKFSKSIRNEYNENVKEGYKGSIEDYIIEFYGEEFLDPAAMAYGGRIGAQEGGLMNLGGMEKDYRQEGGFVPIGGQERADDVPARLSKNEFVFTADAVRAAGGGDIDAGAEVMENLMNNLEQGGQVSEESQGLEGARDMFATSQRLEGVM